ELVLEPAGDGWRAVPNPAAPRLDAAAASGDPAARALGQALARRAEIALAVGTHLAARQGGWLGGGDLLPLTTREVAAALGLHVATVNRVLSAVTLRTPRGTFALRALTAP